MDISHLIYVSNQAALLPALAKSLLQQAGDHSREVIFVDDASSDASLRVMQQLVKDDNRIKILGSDSYAGPVLAINAAAELATGTWLHIMRAENGILPINACHALFALFNSHHADAACGETEISQQPTHELVGKTIVHAPACTLTDHPLEAMMARRDVPASFFCRQEIFHRAQGGDDRYTMLEESLALRLPMVAQRWLTVEAPLLFLPSDHAKPEVDSLAQLRERFLICHAALNTPELLLNEDGRRAIYRRAVATLHEYRMQGELAGVSDAVIAAMPSLWQYLVSRLPFSPINPSLLDDAARSLTDGELPHANAA